MNGGDFCLQSSLNEVLMDIIEEIQRTVHYDGFYKEKVCGLKTD